MKVLNQSGSPWVLSLCFGVSFYKKVIYGEGDKVEGCPAGRIEAEVLECSG